jgi:plasmid maintenance system antidote protein VapI
LLELANARALTPTEISMEMAVDPDTVMLWLIGRGPITTEVAGRLAALLGADISTVLAQHPAAASD